jgi:hypothetical protein
MVGERVVVGDLLYTERKNVVSSIARYSWRIAEQVRLIRFFLERAVKVMRGLDLFVLRRVG